MKSRAAVAFGPGKPLEIVEIDVEPPRSLQMPAAASWEKLPPRPGKCIDCVALTPFASCLRFVLPAAEMRKL